MFEIMRRCVRGVSFTSFRQDERGMTLPLMALTFMTVIGFVGTAVDIARFQLVQSRLSFALDAAGLAAGSTFNTTNLDTELTKYMQVNFPTNYMGASVPGVTSTVSADNNVIDLNASVTMPTTFMNVFGYSTMSVTAFSQITRKAEGLELVMALDNTGSMSGSKLTSLKNAASSLVNILFGSKETVEDLWVGLVPFSQAVNIGTGNTTWVDQTHFATLNWTPTTWGGCVEAREANGRDVVDDPPSVALYKANYWQSTDQMPDPYDDANRWITDRSPLTYATITATRGPNAYCPQAMKPMTASKSAILSSINTMTAVGNTHINLGAIWAWNMLSPRWRGFWAGEMATNGLPLDYGAKHMNKAVIILTDGENTMSSTIRTAYGYLSEGRLGTTSSSTAVTKLNNKLTTICSAMKNKGIYVYTITLGSPGTSTKNLMRSCATAPNYYFDSPSSTELTAVFNAIADSLSNLRVSQ